MINLKKQGFIIILLFCILMAIMAAPLALLEYDNSRLIDKPSTIALPIEMMTYEKNTQEKSYDTLERIYSMKELISEKSGFVVEWRTEVMSEEQQRELVLEVENQISILQDLKALPKASFSEDYRATISKKAYMDMQNPKNPINILRINIDYKDLVVNAYMDMESSVIYEVYMYFKDIHFIDDSQELLIKEASALSPQGFLEYLQGDSDSSQRNEEYFYTEGQYTENSASIYIASYNNDNQAVTEYCFEDNLNFLRVSEKTTISEYWAVEASTH